jgi:2,5-furandicarboxylate decarboxylase 1
MGSPRHSDLDLRKFLDYVRGKGATHFLEIDKPVPPRWITTAIVSGLAKKLRSPVIQFNKVAGSPFPMVTNVCASIDRVARSVDIDADTLSRRFVEANALAVSPVLLPRDDAPVYELSNPISERGLSQFPAMFYSENQQSPYITSAILVARDPDSDAHNLSFNRLMISGNDRAAIYMTPAGHLHQIWSKYSSAGQPTPIAAVIGTHPLWCYACLIAGRLEEDDYPIVGALLGAPIALTPTGIDERLHVPAYSEIVLEGFIEPAQTENEGPFGEFLGFDAETAPQPLVRFTRFNSRRAPIYQDIVAGQVEHLTMSSVSLRARLQRDYFEGLTAVTDFFLPAPMTIFISVDSAEADGFDADALMERLLIHEAYLKQVYCFDNDVDLRKQASVQTAIACFVQPERDIRIYPDCSGNGVDPSEIDGRTSKIAVDARSKKNVVRSKLPGSLLEGFDLNEWIR